MDFNQTPIRKAVLVRKNEKTGRVNYYHVNIGKYADSYAIWCCWGIQSGGSSSKKQLKFISDNMIKILVAYHDFISTYVNKGYETICV